MNIEQLVEAATNAARVNAIMNPAAAQARLNKLKDALKETGSGTETGRLAEAEALLRRSHEFWGCADEIGTNPDGCQVCAYFANGGDDA